MTTAIRVCVCVCVWNIKSSQSLIHLKIKKLLDGAMHLHNDSCKFLIHFEAMDHNYCLTINIAFNLFIENSHIQCKYILSTCF